MKLDDKSLAAKNVMDAFLKRFTCNSFEQAKEEYEAFVLATIMSEGIDGLIMACDPQFSDFCDACIKELERRFK